MDAYITVTIDESTLIEDVQVLGIEGSLVGIEWMQEQVKGFTEFTRLHDNIAEEGGPVLIVSNDEARLRALPHNTTASVISGMFGGPDLHGDIVIGAGLDEQGNLIGMPARQATMLALSVGLAAQLTGVGTTTFLPPDASTDA